MLRKVIAVICVVSMISVSVPAAPPVTTDFNQAVSQLNADAGLLSGWINDQFKYVIPFNATAGNVIPTQLKVFGIELGVEGFATGTKLDTRALRNLPTTIVDTTKVDTFERFPFPLVLGHFKLGLPWGWDGGVRLGGIPSQTFTKGNNSINVGNSVFGLDLRKALIEEGLTHPFGLTIGANYTRAKGSITATEPYNSNLGTTVVGTSSFSSTLSATGTERVDWDTNSIGLQAILNKKILFLNPYVGASLQRHFGTVRTSIASAGTVTLTDVSNPANTGSQAYSVGGSASTIPNPWDLRALIGMEFALFFLKLGVYGEYGGNKNLGGGVGLRAQFR